MAPSPSHSSPWSFSTLCATVSDPDHPDQYGSSSMPIYQATTFKGLPGSENKASDEFDYSRSGNPTRTVLQHHLSKIQGCKHSLAVATGMACLDVITRSVKPGECIIAGDDIYGGTNRLLGLLASNGGIHTKHIDTTDASVLEDTVKATLKAHSDGTGPRLAMVLLETPTNPLLKVVDIKACTAAVRRQVSSVIDTVIVMDNTMMSPALMRPLELGVDVVYDSATKFLSGHHDLMAGVVATNDDHLAKSYAFVINSVGNALAPFESFLLLRGLKTLAIRLAAQQTSSQIIATHLHSLGFTTNYPGLPSHPGRDTHFQQAKGAGAVISFETGDASLSQRIVGGTRLWGVSVSFGCVNSLISMPCLMSHASIDPKVRAARRLPEDLIRLCVGIEDADDLVADLNEALLAAGAVRRQSDGKLVRAQALTYVPAANGSIRLSAAGSSPSAPAPTSVIISSPGKVILLGEHAVVHGVTALAASVSLRCYCLLEDRYDGRLALALPDLSIEHTWAIGELPWDSVPVTASDLGPDTPLDLDAKLLRRIVHAVELTQGGLNESDRSHASCVAFLYLYMTIAGDVSNAGAGQSFTLRSLLPIGAGLGSSAAYSSCLATSLLINQRKVSLSAKTIAKTTAELINRYAFLSEKVIHGNPSGVDNSVSVFGGCLSFRRPNASRNALKANELKLLGNGFGERRLLLTDTGIGRDTKSLVASVAKQLEAEPERVGPLLDEVQHIVDEATLLLTQGGDEKKLSELIRRNHDILVQLNVSHPSLEAIRSALGLLVIGSEKYDLATKLTGAGGGGCAITLLPSSSTAGKVEEEGIQTLVRLGMKCYPTSLGGPGVSILSGVELEKLTKGITTGIEGEGGDVAAASGGLRQRFVALGDRQLEEWLEGKIAGWQRVGD